MADAEAQNDLEAPLISIGVLAERVGLSVSAIRRYETEGLLIPHRTESGRRLFSHEDISRVRNIQHMIQDVGLNVEGIRRMQALLPCWDLLPCNGKRESCPAYMDNSRPCWTIHGMACAPKGNECRECVVYRFGSLCTEQIKTLVYDQTNRQDNSVAIRELMDRRRRSRKEE